MGIVDKTVEAGKKTVDLGVKAGKMGIEVGKKGVERTKERMRTKTCSECIHYEQIDEHKGTARLQGSDCLQQTFLSVHSEPSHRGK